MSALNTIIIYFNEQSSDNMRLYNKHKHDKNCPMILAMELDGKSINSEDNEDDEDDYVEKINKIIYAQNTHTDTIDKNEEGYYITLFCNSCEKNVYIVCTSRTLDPYHTPCRFCYNEDWILSERFLCDTCIEETIYPVNLLSWSKRIKTVNDYYYNHKSHIA